jgi:membrane-associated phospholipid phosphatase
MQRTHFRVLLIGHPAFLLVLFCSPLAATELQTRVSEPPPTQDAGSTAAKPSPAEPSPHRVEKLTELPRAILRDQTFLWLRPFRLQRDDVPWAAAILGTTAGLIAIDRRVGQGLSDTRPGGGFAFSHRVGQLGDALTDFGVAGAFYLVGHWRGEERARTTGLLGLQAVTESLVVVEVIKTASRRPRPTLLGGRTRNHNADGEFFTGGRSFPSGHAAEAWSLATVIAEQYQHRRWVPPTAYSLAGLVAISRVGARRHFPADVFVGSVLGYLIGRHVSHGPPSGSSGKPRSLRLLPYIPPSGGSGLVVSWEF